MHNTGTVLFCETSNDEQAVDNARNYCTMNGYTSEVVKIVRRETETVVIWR